MGTFELVFLFFTRLNLLWNRIQDVTDMKYSGNCLLGSTTLG